MTMIAEFKKKYNYNLLSEKEQYSLKGKGMGNMMSKPGKNCPPPVDEGKKEVKDKFL